MAARAHDRDAQASSGRAWRCHRAHQAPRSLGARPPARTWAASDESGLAPGRSSGWARPYHMIVGVSVAGPGCESGGPALLLGGPAFASLRAAQHAVVSCGGSDSAADTGHCTTKWTPSLCIAFTKTNVTDGATGGYLLPRSSPHLRRFCGGPCLVLDDRRPPAVEDLGGLPAARLSVRPACADRSSERFGVTAFLEELGHRGCVNSAKLRATSPGLVRAGMASRGTATTLEQFCLPDSRESGHPGPGFAVIALASVTRRRARHHAACLLLGSPR